MISYRTLSFTESLEELDKYSVNGNSRNDFQITITNLADKKDITSVQLHR